MGEEEEGKATRVLHCGRRQQAVKNLVSCPSASGALYPEVGDNTVIAGSHAEHLLQDPGSSQAASGFLDSPLSTVI